MLNVDALNSTQGILKKKRTYLFFFLSKIVNAQKVKENLVKQLRLLKNKIKTEKITQIMRPQEVQNKV